MMKHGIICRSDVDTQCTRTHKQPRAGRWPVATLAGLILLAISAPTTWAKLSQPSDKIYGRAPTATGTLAVMFPGGVTAVTNNAVVSTTMKPADFRVSASALTLKDLDGDTGLSSSLDTAAVTWVWKYNNVALTAAELAAPFSTNFLGKTLTVAASASVAVSSLTGAPKTGSPSPLTSVTYSLVVPASPPVVRVNGTSFAMNSGFPQTGFSQAQFQFWMDGTSAAGNSNYTFSPTNPAAWVTVDTTTGIVKFTSVPTAAQTVNITITDNRGGPSTTFAFSVAKWFINNGSIRSKRSDGGSICTAKGGYSYASYAELVGAAPISTNTRRAGRSLWEEWGDLSVVEYNGAGWGAYPETYAESAGVGGGWYTVDLYRGISTSQDGYTDYAGYLTACVKSM